MALILVEVEGSIHLIKYDITQYVTRKQTEDVFKGMID